MAGRPKKSNDFNDLTFGTRRFKQTIQSHKEVLDKFYVGFEDARVLKGKSKIFLDTNVLLRIYSTSFKEREKLLQFFKDFKSRIVLTGQVQFEYVKNREHVITKFSEDVSKIQIDFKSTIIGGVTKFSSDYKKILMDYPVIQTELDKLSTQVKKLLETINKEVPNDKVSIHNILYKDDFISLFQELELLNPLYGDFLKKIKLEFDEFLKDININKIDINKETIKAFPGCAENKGRGKDPVGDYVIFHEMMHYAKTHECDVIFLTYDIEKGDWMQKESKKPHLHYVENFYQNTNRMLYILDGERTFVDLGFNVKSLINDIEEKTRELSIQINHLWDVNHWLSNCASIKDHKMIFTGTYAPQGTDGSNININDWLELGKQYEVSCFVKSSIGTTGMFQLWCHDQTESGNSIATQYKTPSQDGEIIGLIFQAKFNKNIRIHLQYTPGEGQIEVSDVKITEKTYNNI